MFKRFGSELPLLAAAAFIGFVIWLIAKQGDIGEDTVSVPVQIDNAPPNMIIVVRPSEVDLRVSFPRELSNRIVTPSFVVHVNVKDAFLEASKWPTPTAPQEQPYALSPHRDVRTQLPHTVSITEIVPANVTLEATLRTRRVDVVVPQTGALPPTLDLQGPPVPESAKVLLTGSEEALNNLAERGGNRIETEPVDLTPLRASTQLTRNLILPAGLTILQPRETKMAVFIGVAERSTTRTLTAIPVTILTYAEGLTAQVTPKVVDLMLQGPPSALDTLKAEDFVFAPARALVEEAGRAQTAALDVRLNNRVPSDVATKVRIVRCAPASVAIEYVRNSVQNGPTPTATPRGSN